MKRDTVNKRADSMLNRAFHTWCVGNWYLFLETHGFDEDGHLDLQRLMTADEFGDEPRLVADDDIMFLGRMANHGTALLIQDFMNLLQEHLKGNLARYGLRIVLLSRNQGIGVALAT